MEKIVITSKDVIREYDVKSEVLKSDDGRTSTEKKASRQEILTLVSCLFDKRVSERVETSLSENSYYQHVRYENNNELKITVYVN